MERNELAAPPGSDIRAVRTEERGLTDYSRMEIWARYESALAMINALCRPRGSEGHRDWLMSIPARPDYDPDLVIASGLRAVPTLIDTVRVCMDLLERAGEKLGEDPPDTHWWEDWFTLIGEHVILTDEGWEPGANKDSYLKAGMPEAILGELNAPESGPPVVPRDQSLRSEPDLKQRVFEARERYRAEAAWDAAVERRDAETRE